MTFKKNKKVKKIEIFKIMNWCVIFFLIWSFLPIISAYSNTQNKSFKNKLNSNNAPIRIKSNKMIVLDKKNEIIFKGDVFASQGNMTIEADTLTVKYKKEGKNSYNFSSNSTNRRIKEISAKGHVKITNKSITALSDYALFLKNKNVIILKGHARIIKTNNQIQGDIITIYLNQNKSIVSAQKGNKVEAIIFPSQKR